MTPRHQRPPGPGDPAASLGASTRPSSTAPAPRTIASSELLEGQSCVLIAHAGQHYRLQTTRQGKLILTK